ncbi:OmpA family protein [Ralstonia flaminis]|uniref:Peptidoglycan-associated lipoprotein n=1 Tax=Ralstonia flaminis TaxID=3058597 RepID=A0ABM9K8X3_9RALS|nr:OmpA family protein [Ralstonia sp. LMG 18101]CAJ0818150.1 Peptidoglycan-associated lipoprotein [Ralstonia sp. LMG 18101]
MTGYPYRTLFVWIAALALFWLGACSPWSSAWNIGLATAVGLVACVALVMATRRIRARRAASRQVLAAINGALQALPGDTRRNTPLVLTVGESTGVLAQAFENNVVQITDAAIWVRVDEPARLKHIANALKRWRDGQGPDAVAYLVDADSAVDDAAFAAATQQWRTAVDEASRAVGYALPVCVAVYVAEVEAAQQACPWFGASGTLPPALNTLADQVCAATLAHARWVPHEARTRWAHHVARLDAAARWATADLLPGLADTKRGTRPINMAAFGLTMVRGTPTSASLVGRYVGAITGLAQPLPSGTPARLPLPDALLPGIAPQQMRRVLPRALAHAFVALTVALCAATAASAWQNRELIARVQADVTRYEAIPPANDAARVDALAAIKRDRDELERYARMGVPPRLGLGFYRAGARLPAINTLIASYQPPAPPPSMIELDSLSLFKTGSAVLNPGSNRVMFGALEMIKAHPNKRVLVAGHTDSVGSPAFNRKLSEARAASVRNWLADASGIPLSQFAIQGYGDTRPKASNDTDAGRAANRRVEITLIPDCRDARNSDSPKGQPACSFE